MSIKIIETLDGLLQLFHLPLLEGFFMYVHKTRMPYIDSTDRFVVEE